MTDDLTPPHWGIERPFAYCCAEAGGDPRACDCINKNHGFAFFDAPNHANQIEAVAHVIHCITDTCVDEGDRIYLGSTNDAHMLVRQARRLLKIAAAMQPSSEGKP
ncbi:MAG: hypothetical protein RL254_800 [Planctomycetota bacterium]